MSIETFLHRFLPSPTGSTRTLLLLHGTGGNEIDMLQWAPMLALNDNLLAPRGKVLENGMPRFFRRVRPGLLDQEDLRFRTDELAEFLVASAKEYGFNPNRMVAIGYSNGANIAASLLMRHPDVLAGAALLHPMIPFVPENPPIFTGQPIFISAGEEDPMCPLPDSLELQRMLISYGATVSLKTYPGGHELSRNELLDLKNWLQWEGDQNG